MVMLQGGQGACSISEYILDPVSVNASTGTRYHLILHIEVIREERWPFN